MSKQQPCHRLSFHFWSKDFSTLKMHRKLIAVTKLSLENMYLFEICTVWVYQIELHALSLIFRCYLWLPVSLTTYCTPFWPGSLSAYPSWSWRQFDWPNWRRTLRWPWRGSYRGKSPCYLEIDPPRRLPSRLSLLQMLNPRAQPPCHPREAMSVSFTSVNLMWWNANHLPPRSNNPSNRNAS